MACNGCGSGSGETPTGCGNKGHCSSGGCSRMEVYNWLSDVAINPYDDFNIFEISFKSGARKGFFRNVNHLDIYAGDLVVVESAIGYDIGTVSLGGELVKIQMKKRRVKEDNPDIMPILRLAGEKELEIMEEARSREKETMLKARVLARNLGLEMKLGDVEYQADNKKATFFYTADSRVDFRELIKVLAREFRVKIEMRQIGARQEAGRVGGIGSCGRELCCSTWLTSFKSVNTSAARYQNLSINQTKLSGQCGRLKCCLNYELDTYLDALKDFPENADFIKTEVGDARLVKTDVLKGLMFYVYPQSGTFYPIPIEKVKEILLMNAQGLKPADLLEVADIQEKDAADEFVDVVGQVSLKSLEKTEKRVKNKKKQQNQREQQKSQGENNRPATEGKSAQPAAGERPQQQRENRDNRNNRPPQTQNPNRPQQNRPPQGENKASLGIREQKIMPESERIRPQGEEKPREEGLHKKNNKKFFNKKKNFPPKNGGGNQEG